MAEPREMSWLEDDGRIIATERYGFVFQRPNVKLPQLVLDAEEAWREAVKKQLIANIEGFGKDGPHG